MPHSSARLLLLLAPWMVLPVYVALGTGVAERPQSKRHDKRNFVQLGNMMMCATGRFPSDYLDYGCFCGPGGNMKHAAIDDTDQCCKDHDFCYEYLSRRCPSYLFGLVPFPYLAIYNYKYDSCMSVFGTSWVEVSRGVYQAPERTANVTIQCGTKQSGDKRSAKCRELLCNCDRKFSLCLGRSNYDNKYYSVNVREKCEPTAP